MNTAPTNTALLLRRGFTLLEILVVVVIVGIIVAVLLVAMSATIGSARAASAERQLSSVAVAVEAFHNDLGYYPPLLVYEDSGWRIGSRFDFDAPSDADKVANSVAEDGVIVPESLPNPRVVPVLRQSRYSSEYTPAVYLLGAGDLNTRVGDSGSQRTGQPNAGANTDDDDGAAGPGIRLPGPDRSWGGAADRSRSRPQKTGRVYGPYLDPGSLGDNLQVESATGLFKILDPWGQPIRYAINWPTRDPDNNEASVARLPVEFRSFSAVERHIENGEPALEFEREALTARFMLLSAGPNREVRPDGAPRPVFGDRKADAEEMSPFIQNLENDFDPGTLSREEQEYLLDALKSNVRVAR